MQDFDLPQNVDEGAVFIQCVRILKNVLLQCYPGEYDEVTEAFKPELLFACRAPLNLQEEVKRVLTDIGKR